MVSDLPENTRIVRDETGQEAWDSVTTEYTPYGETLRETVVNRDGSIIRSELATPDSAVSGGAKPLSKSTMQAAVTLYNWLARRDRADDKVTVFAFSMDSFQPETNGDPLASGAKPAEK